MPKRIEHKIDENGLELKWCGRCKQFKSLDSFAKHSGKWDGLQERCSECRHLQWQEQGKKTRKSKPIEEKRAIHRRAVIRSYGMDVADFETMLKNQDYKCEICGSSNWGKPNPCIDHDHSTGLVRGLLCNRCNRTLGFVEDSVELLESMKKYLKKYGK